MSLLFEFMVYVPGTTSYVAIWVLERRRWKETPAEPAAVTAAKDSLRTERGAA